MSQEYKKLRKEWYAKLKDDGFDDIEDSQGRLKEYASSLLSRPSFVLNQNGGWEAKQEYYRMACQFLNEYEFPSKISEAIWTYHSEAISARNISKLLKKAFPKRKGLGKSSVYNIIKALRNIMWKKYLI